MTAPTALSLSARLRLRTAIFLAGACVMVLQVLGTRIIGPHYGVGLYVWTALIAVTLVALALGYWLGGKLADRRPSLLWFAFVLLAAAVKASPDAASVRDFGRYLALTQDAAESGAGAGTDVPEAVTLAAVTADPGDLDARATRASHLLLLRRPDDANAVFDDVTVFFETLPPGQQAIIAAINQARGQHELARAMLAKINTGILNAGELGLLHDIATQSASEKN